MQKISSSVTAATVKRVVQLMPRLTHHNSAQLIRTGTTSSSCKSLLALVCSARPADPDTKAAADLHAGGRSLDPDETGTVFRAGVRGGLCRAQRQRFGWLVRFAIAKLLRRRR